MGVPRPWHGKGRCPMRRILTVLLGVAVLAGTARAAEKYTRITARQLFGMRSKFVKEGTRIEYPALMGSADKVEEQLDKAENVVGVRAKTASPEVTIVIMYDKKNEDILDLFWTLPERAAVTIYGQLKEFSTGGIYILVDDLKPGWPDAKQICPTCGGTGKVPVGRSGGGTIHRRGGMRPGEQRKR